MLHHASEEARVDAPLVKTTDVGDSTDADAKLTLFTAPTVHGYRKGADVAGRYCSDDMPPVTYMYSAFEPEKQTFKAVSVTDDELPRVALTDPSTTLLGIVGDGVPDIVQSTDSGRYCWENVGLASFDRRHPQHGPQPSVTLTQNKVAVSGSGDDGLVDLVVDARQGSDSRHPGDSDLLRRASRLAGLNATA